MKKLYICGLPGGGKGLLRLLLDGHPEIFNPGLICCPGLSLLKEDFIHSHLDRLEIERKDSLKDKPIFINKNLIQLNIHGKIYSVSIGNIWTQLLRNGFYYLLIDYPSLHFFLN